MINRLGEVKVDCAKESTHLLRNCSFLFFFSFVPLYFLSFQLNNIKLIFFFLRYFISPRPNNVWKEKKKKKQGKG